MGVEFLSETEKQMNCVLSSTNDSLSKIRIGKVDPSILYCIKVLVHGNVSLLQNISSITTHDFKTLIIRPFEKGMLHPIEEAISKSNLNLNPLNDGESIKVISPPITEERRIELVKIVKEEIEESKIKIRILRQNARKIIDSMTKNGLSRDLKKEYENKLQKLTDLFVKKLDEVFSNKEKSLMTT